MTIVTDRGNFNSFKDILFDMKFESYDSIRIIDTQVIVNQIHLGGIMGLLTKAEIEEIQKQVS